MRFSLNLLTLALLTACGSSVAADFGVANANTSRVKDGAYQCKNCVVASGVNGVVTATAGYIDSSNKHAGNAFGTDDDGANASLSGDVRYQNGADYRSQVQAHQLGLDNGFATLSTGRLGQYQLDMDYQSITTYQAGAAQSNLWHNDGMLVPSPYGRIFDLALERQRAGIGLDYDFGDIAALVDISTFVRYDREEKTGTKSASLLAQRPMNFGLPVDESTDKLSAGAVMSGANWLSELSYHGSQYSNHINNISLPYASDVYAATPDNQAHQLTLSGQYRLDTSVVNGRVVAGHMVQDDALIQMSGNPLQNWDGQVDTLDAKLAATSMLTNRWRVGGSLDYSKRDNDSSVHEFMQLDYNPLNGSFTQNVPLDIERQTVKLNTSYRIASGYRLQAGYDFKQVERSYGERERTEDNSLWAELDIRTFETVRFDIKGSYGNRGGSRYQANELTSSEESSLLRKFNLADRERTEVEVGMQYTPLTWLVLDVTTRYAFDDYYHTDLGLNESRDYGYDINLSLQLTEQLNAYGFAGQQWIDSQQSGDQSARWQADINDSFINLGAGASYSGLLDDKLTLGLDYLFANSNGETLVNQEQAGAYGDYFSFNHSLELYGQYALSDTMQLKLAYQFERYFDTDASQMQLDSLTGITTLGMVDNNYNAHQLMLSFSYLLP